MSNLDVSQLNTNRYKWKWFSGAWRRFDMRFGRWEFELTDAQMQRKLRTDRRKSEPTHPKEPAE